MSPDYVRIQTRDGFVMDGEPGGHAFHGNQWTGGLGANLKTAGPGGVYDSRSDRVYPEGTKYYSMQAGSYESRICPLVNGKIMFKGDMTGAEMDHATAFNRIVDAAPLAGVKMENVKISDQPYNFEVGVQAMTAAGSVDRGVNRITIYAPAVSAYGTQEMQDTLAHESGHVLFNQALAHPALGKYLEDNAEKFIEKGGITPYSKKYWAEHEKDPSHATFVTAAHETFAEMHMLVARDGRELLGSHKMLGKEEANGVPPVWTKFYDTVMKTAKKEKFVRDEA